MIKRIAKILLVIAAAFSVFLQVSVTTYADATVTKGEFDFEGMTIRRIWLNTTDPYFMLDDYDRVWLYPGLNVTAYGSFSETGKDGSLMSPMEEVFRQIGGEYLESGDTVTLRLNGDELILAVGSRDVTFNGEIISGDLTEDQKPVRADASANGCNTFLTEEYPVVYLPAAYILNVFQADIYVDSNSQSLYGAVPIIRTEQVPSYEVVYRSITKDETISYGNCYEMLKDGTIELKKEIADNIVALQNEDGGFSILPPNADMEQENLNARLGTLKGASTLEEGTTVSELRYLAEYLSSTGGTGGEYLEAFQKGVEFLLVSQQESGGWQVRPSSPVGYYGNINLSDGSVTGILEFFSEIALLNEPGFKFVRRSVNQEEIKAAFERGIRFILSVQLEYQGVKTGWAAQYRPDSAVTMGKTYERESVSAAATAEVTRLLMSVRNPGQEITQSVFSSLDWLGSVKIEDKEAVVIEDFSMQNGYDIFLMDGSGTWAMNYQYQAGRFVPLYSDADPLRSNQNEVNNWNSKNADRLIWYGTRTSVPYYDNELGVSLLDEELSIWKGYLENGWPELPRDNREPAFPGGVMTKKTGSSDTKPKCSGSWKKDQTGWWYEYTDGNYPVSQWEEINGEWYYFDQIGYMVTGWIYYKSQWYYLNSSGAMETGWKYLNGQWYYLMSEGAMYVGWLKADGKWYYMKQDGSMACNTQIDGYSLDEGGVWRQ